MTPLHYLGNFLHEVFAAIPLWAVRGLFLSTFAVLLVWVVRLPRDAARAEPNSPWTDDLRLWAVVALLIQIFVYALI